MTCAVIDTNILMYIYIFKVDVITSLKEKGFSKIFVPDRVVDELKILKSKLGGKYSKAAKIALGVINELEIIETDKSIAGTDMALIDLCRKKGCVLITNDRDLRKKAKRDGIVVGYIRDKTKIFVEDLN